MQQKLRKNKVLLLCGESKLQTSQFQDIAVLNSFRRNDLRERGINCINLFDIDLDGACAGKICKQIDLALRREHADNPSLQYAPLAFLHVYWRFIRYFQFKKKLDIWIKQNSPKKLVVSSDRDKDLLLAAQSVCRKNRVKLEVHSGALDEYSYSGIANYLVPDDFPAKNQLDPIWLTYMTAFLRKIIKVQTLIQPYGNMSFNGYSAQYFSWSRSICWIVSIKSLFKKKVLRRYSSESMVIQPTNPDPGYPILINRKFWLEFDEDDHILINSAIFLFYKKYPIKHLHALYKSLSLFLKTSGVKRIISIHDTIPSVRMLCYAAKPLGIRVDYLPHGIIWEDSGSPSTRSVFSPDRTLAWNRGSKSSLVRNESSAITVTHPRNKASFRNTRPIGRDYSQLKVLVFLSGRIIHSLEQRIDCFEDDFLEIYNGLTKLNITRIEIKHHYSLPAVTAKMKKTIKQLEVACGCKFSILDSHIDSKTLMEKYDLIIFGSCTTGILEAMRSSTPFVVFRGYLTNAGVLAGYDLPEANSSQELVDRVLNYDSEYFNKQFKKCAMSLQEGPHPLDPLLGSSKQVS